MEAGGAWNWFKGAVGDAADWTKGAVESGMKELGIGRPGIIEPQRTQFLPQQKAALGMLEQQALGRTPSAAELQQRQGLEQALRNQMAMSASQRGFGTGGRTRQMQQQLGDTSLAGAMQASQLRAQEQARAQQQYSNMLNTAAQQDQAFQLALAEAQRQGPESLLKFLTNTGKSVGSIAALV